MSKGYYMELIKWIPVFLLGALSESTMQIFLKKGANQNSHVYGIKYYLRLAINKWILLGITVNIVDMVTWLVILTNIPLSIAFPMTGLQKIMIIFFTAFFLKEHISKVEWLGISFIITGLSIIIIAGN